MMFFEQDDVSEFVTFNSMTNALVDCCVFFFTHLCVLITGEGNVSEMF